MFAELSQLTPWPTWWMRYDRVRPIIGKGVACQVVALDAFYVLVW